MTHIGIDISKAFFDAHLSGRNRRFKYDEAGIKDFIAILPVDAVCVMEATGPYSYRLAEALYYRSIAVSMVNPLIIKRFGQMSLRRTKTDSMDALLITEFARRESLKPFVPLDDAKNRLKQMVSALETLKEQSQALGNAVGALRALPRVCDDAVMGMETSIAAINEAMAKLKKIIALETNAAYGKLAENLLTIPGFGSATVPILLVSTDGFASFNSSRQLAAYVGLGPGTKESGTSVRGKGTICRIGNSVLRAKLYMCSMTAARKNKACKALYDRLVANGKPKKVALIAVAHKLLKQAFGIAKNGVAYDKNLSEVA